METPFFTDLKQRLSRARGTPAPTGRARVDDVSGRGGRGSAGKATPRQLKSCIMHEEEETMPCEDDGTFKGPVIRVATFLRRSVPRGISHLVLKSVLATILACGATVATAEAPKRGGVLTYMIPADAGRASMATARPPTRRCTATAPFYSVLIRVNPNNPASTTDFVCDLCTEMPKPTDDGKTYTFKIREGVKFHDGSPLTAQDVAASWNKIIHPPKGVASARQNYYGWSTRSRRPTTTPWCSI